MTARTKLANISAALVGRRSQEPAIPAEAAAHGQRLGSWGRVTAGRWGALPVALAAAGALLLLAVGWYAASAVSARARIAPAAFERINAGMGREEVQVAIGLPPGDYRDEGHKPGGRRYTEWSEEAAAEEFGAGETAGRLAWEGNQYSIVVGFDQAGVVQWKTLWRHVPPTPRGPVEKALDWLTR